MSIAILFILLLIVQIVMLVKTIREPGKKGWSILLSTIITSIALVAAFFTYSWINMYYIGWNFFVYLIINIAAGAAFLIMLIISVIMKSKKKGNNDLQESVENGHEKASVKKSLIINILTIAFAFVIALFIEDLPYWIEQQNNKITANEAKEQIIILLNQQYGDGNYEIVEMAEGNICHSCSWLGPGIDGYEFTMSTDYLDKSFTVSLTKEDFEIYENDFLNDYYKENLGITDLEDHLKDYKVNKLNEAISQNFNAEINFGNRFIKDYSKMSYGRIPTIEELSGLVELYDPKIEIKDDLKTKDELLDYLVDFSKFYIGELDTSGITYSNTDKYFRYKYDYSKLGINDYSDRYSGYDGYVLAGNYEYSEEQGRYVVQDEDTIVRICIMDNVTTFRTEDILKD